MDLEKAYDMGNKEALLQVLRMYDMGGKLGDICGGREWRLPGLFKANDLVLYDESE